MKNYKVGTYMLCETLEKMAIKKAKQYLKTLPRNQQDSKSAAIRWCIQNAPDPIKLSSTNI